MPIIIEGGSRSAGWWWARHLEDVEKNERAELVSNNGLSAETVPELFREMHGMAMGSKAKNYFYQANINPRADEHLTAAQRREAVATLGRNLGLEGQPHFVIEHEKAGRVHQHVVWLRVNLDTMKAIPDSLTAQIHERTSRELEIRFDLERGQSILVPNRDFARPERLAKKHERFRGAQSGIDTRAISAELKALRERSDSGQSFRAGMEAAGYVLARGDRRDYMVIDQAGHGHSLARRLGMKAEDVRAFMKGIDAGSLPSVAEATTRQMARQAAPAERQKHRRAIAAGAESTPTDGPQKGREGQAKAERPLSATQGAVRAAWSLSRTGEQLTEALAARGIGLACVTAEEASANYRRRAFAKQVGGYVQPLREGEIVAVNEQGYVYRFSPHMVGVDRGDIAKRLASIDAGGLLSVSDTKQVMREVRRAEGAEQQADKRERTRPLSGVEQRIIECQQQAEHGFWVDRGRGDERVSGAEALATALDRGGIAVVRVTAGDLKALDALQRDEDFARLVADSNREARRSQHFAGLDEGAIAAVDRYGNVHRLNPHKIDLEHLASELLVAARIDDPAVACLHGVTEARSEFEIEREAIAAFRDEWTQQRLDRATETSTRAAEQGPERDDPGIRDPDDIAAGLAKGVERAASAALNFFADSFAPPPPPTREQLREQNEAHKAARAEQAGRQEKDQRLAQTLDMIRAARARGQLDEEEEKRRQRLREQELELRRDR
jgi:MobA/VirD2-like, nuclease domain